MSISRVGLGVGVHAVVADDDPRVLVCIAVDASEADEFWLAGEDVNGRALVGVGWSGGDDEYFSCCPPGGETCMAFVLQTSLSLKINKK